MTAAKLKICESIHWFSSLL